MIKSIIVNYWKISFAILCPFSVNTIPLYGQIETASTISAPFLPESLVEIFFLGDEIRMPPIQFNDKPDTLTAVDHYDCDLFAETILSPITCPGRGDGVLTILPMGGTPPYFFSKNGRRFSKTNKFFNLTPGYYEPAISDSNNCMVAIPPITVEEAPLLSIHIDNLELKAAIPQEITPIITNGKGELIYTWSANNLEDLSCTDCLSPTITPTNSQLYQLSVVDENGCKATARIRVLVEKNRQLFVPTGFTPNEDGANDRLTVYGIAGTEILSFKIFDRWGELVFRSNAFEVNDLTAGWDGYFKGKPMSSNVFAWVVEARFSDGTLKLEKGHSTLIR